MSLLNEAKMPSLKDKIDEVEELRTKLEKKDMKIGKAIKKSAKKK